MHKPRTLSTVLGFSLLWLGFDLGLGLTLGPGVVSAETLGRLFSTPEKRQELDEFRNNPDLGEEVVPAVVEALDPNSGPVVPTITFNGIVLRSDGQNSSWINGSQIQSGQSTKEGIDVQPSTDGGGSVKLILPAGTQTISLKPGQKIDLTTGSLLEAYEYRVREDAAAALERPSDDKFGDLLPSIDLPEPGNLLKMLLPGAEKAGS